MWGVSVRLDPPNNGFIVFSPELHCSRKRRPTLVGVLRLNFHFQRSGGELQLELKKGVSQEYVTRSNYTELAGLRVLIADR